MISVWPIISKSNVQSYLAKATLLLAFTKHNQSFSFSIQLFHITINYFLLHKSQDHGSKTCINQIWMLNKKIAQVITGKFRPIFIFKLCLKLKRLWIISTYMHKRTWLVRSFFKIVVVNVIRSDMTKIKKPTIFLIIQGLSDLWTKFQNMWQVTPPKTKITWQKKQ